MVAMKKVLLLVALVLITSPVMGAVIIDVNTSGEAENVARIDYEVTNGTYPRAFALDVSVDGSAVISNVYDYHVGESNNIAKGYGIFPGNIQINVSGDVTDYGTPVAPAGAPDTPGQTGSNSITLEMGSLYFGSINVPPVSGTLCRILVSGSTQMTVTEDATRGGVVLEDATSASVDLSGATAIQIGSTECFDSGHADYSAWVDVNRPESWCYTYQCYGDAEGWDEAFGKGTVRVGLDDLDVLLAGWRQPYSGDPTQDGLDPGSDPDTWIAADFDRDDEAFGKGTVRVGLEDLDILILNWRTDAGIAQDCGGSILNELP